jgi:hypothetical protein
MRTEFYGTTANRHNDRTRTEVMPSDEDVAVSGFGAMPQHGIVPMNMPV